jgi:hypothetical protein
VSQLAAVHMTGRLGRWLIESCRSPSPTAPETSSGISKPIADAISMRHDPISWDQQGQCLAAAALSRSARET